MVHIHMGYDISPDGWARRIMHPRSRGNDFHPHALREAGWGTVRVSKPIPEVGILYRGSFRDVFHAGLIHVPPV